MPGLREALLLVAAASLLAEPFHDLPRGLILRSVASRSPLPLLCMAMSSVLGSQLRAWWRGSAALKYAAPRCDREWPASAPASWSEAGYSGDVAVMGRRPAWWPPGLALGAPLAAYDG